MTTTSGQGWPDPSAVEPEMAPPYAPLEMPRQILESRTRYGIGEVIARLFLRDA